MAQMSDPHHALVSFQAALLSGGIQPIKCIRHPELFYLSDLPQQSPRLTFALIDNELVVKAVVLFVKADSDNGMPHSHIGYAVAEAFRGQGLAYEVVEKSIDELSTMLKGKLPCMYINAVVGVDNVPSQKVAARLINSSSDQIVDIVSGLPALHYVRCIDLV